MHFLFFFPPKENLILNVIMKEICNSLQHPESVGQNTVHISQRLGVGEFRLKKDSCCTIGELHDCAYNLSSLLQSQFT